MTDHVLMQLTCAFASSPISVLPRATYILVLPLWSLYVERQLVTGPYIFLSMKFEKKNVSYAASGRQVHEAGDIMCVCVCVHLCVCYDSQVFRNVSGM